ncbi:MAG: MFS transporter [Vulcanisaeta sp. AZ3]|jgi:MFS family permease
MRTELWSSINEGQRRAVLINALLGSLLGSMNMASIVIALPAILKGVGINPTSSLGFIVMMWLMFSYPLVTAVTVPIIGRLSDMFGRGRVFTIGDALFTAISLLMGLVPGYGIIAGLQLVAYRFIQGIAGSMMFSNSAALITDVYPPERRGVAQGIVGIAFSAGSVSGLVVGGLLAIINWRLVFLFNVPIGLVSTLWALRSVYRLPTGFSRVSIDYVGAVLLSASLIFVLMGLLLSMMPYGGSSLGWGNPMVWISLVIGIVLFGALIFVERRIREPMLKINLFGIRQFTYGVFSSFFLFMAMGANIFVLSLLLQAIYLPLVYKIPYSETPLWAGIFLIPSSIANAIFAPIGGKLLNKLGARVVSTLGAILFGVGFELLALLPMNFNYVEFAAILVITGIGSGLFQSPNIVSILSAVPSSDRAAASGLRASMQNIGSLMSFALFLTLIITGSAAALPVALYRALINAGVPMSDARTLVSIPPVYALFAAFLGFDPIKTLIEQAHISLSPSVFANIENITFFPSAIAPAMQLGFHLAYHMAAIFAFAAAAFSYLRGKEAFHVMQEQVQVVERRVGKVADDPVNDYRGDLDLKNDPVLRKAYAAYLLMNTEISETVIRALSVKELVYTIAATSHAPDWFIDFVKNMNDCNLDIKVISLLTNYLKPPDWVNDLVNGWIKINYSNENKNNIK